jgi:hypothetical protein
MKSRVVDFYVNPEDMSRVVSTIENEVIPGFQRLPHFLGLTVIKSETAGRSEVIAASYWDDGLEESERESQRFVDEIIRATGSNPSRRTFDVVYAQVRNSAGALSVDPAAAT